jgi:hypothetical protein
MTHTQPQMSKKEKPRRRRRKKANRKTNDRLVKWRAVIPVLFGAVMTGAKWGKNEEEEFNSWWAPGNISCLLALLLRELCCCFLDTRRQGH